MELIAVTTAVIVVALLVGAGLPLVGALLERRAAAR